MTCQVKEGWHFQKTRIMIHSFAGDSQIVAFISSGVIFCSELTSLGYPVNLMLINNGEFDVDK